MFDPRMESRTLSRKSKARGIEIQGYCIAAPVMLPYSSRWKVIFFGEAPCC